MLNRTAPVVASNERSRAANRSPRYPPVFSKVSPPYPMPPKIRSQRAERLRNSPAMPATRTHCTGWVAMRKIRQLKTRVSTGSTKAPTPSKLSNHSAISAPTIPIQLPTAPAPSPCPNEVASAAS